MFSPLIVRLNISMKLVHCCANCVKQLRFECVFFTLGRTHTHNSQIHSCKKQVCFAIRKVRVNYSFACSLFFVCVSVYTMKKESGICVRDSWSLAQQFKLIRLFFVFYLSGRFYIDYPEWKVYIKYFRRAEKKKKKKSIWDAKHSCCWLMYMREFKWNWISLWSKHIKKKSRNFTDGFDTTGGNYLHFYFLGILHCEFDNICKWYLAFTSPQWTINVVNVTVYGMHHIFFVSMEFVFQLIYLKPGISYKIHMHECVCLWHGIA